MFRPRQWCAVLACLAVVVAGGCGRRGAAGPDTVRVGLAVSLTGVYESVGKDMRGGFELYLAQHGGELGGRKVDLVVADEGDGPATARPAVQRLLKQDRVDAVTGIVSGASHAAVAPMAQEMRVPLVSANGRPDMTDVSWVWHTAYLSDEPGQAIAPYVRGHVAGTVYAIGPDYQGGRDELRGFVNTYTLAGGKLANPGGAATFTPFPQTTNFLPYFADVARSGAKAIYAFYAGKAAIDFVTQWARSDVRHLPLYGAFLTEGTVLAAQGASAQGILNVLNYAPDLDNAANREFVAGWRSKHGGAPTTFAMAAYDAAAVLDQAIGSIRGKVTPAAINDAIGRLGQIDSPRGPWQFSPTTHSPVQPWYLRRVQRDGTALSNVHIEDLATIG